MTRVEARPCPAPPAPGLRGVWGASPPGRPPGYALPRSAARARRRRGYQWGGRQDRSDSPLTVRVCHGQAQEGAAGRLTLGPVLAERQRARRPHPAAGVVHEAVGGALGLKKSQDREGLQLRVRQVAQGLEAELGQQRAGAGGPFSLDKAGVSGRGVEAGERPAVVGRGCAFVHVGVRWVE